MARNLFFKWHLATLLLAFAVQAQDPHAVSDTILATENVYLSLTDGNLQKASQDLHDTIECRESASGSVLTLRDQQQFLAYLCGQDKGWIFVSFTHLDYEHTKDDTVRVTGWLCVKIDKQETVERIPFVHVWKWKNKKLYRMEQ